MIRTELEHCVLGVVWQRGPCSAYAVRYQFAKSASAHWSASAGSIYPVVERLVRAGLVMSTPKPRGRRMTSELQITPQGLTTLRDWIVRLDRAATSATYDSVRTRLLFIHAVRGAADRQAIIEQAISETQQRRAELDALMEKDEPMEALATLGARYELDARLAWLAEFSARLRQLGDV